jgi:hypothetical protein
MFIVLMKKLFRHLTGFYGHDKKMYQRVLRIWLKSLPPQKALHNSCILSLNHTMYVTAVTLYQPVIKRQIKLD